MNAAGTGNGLQRAERERLAVRQALLEDAMDVLRWRNDPLVCAMSRHHEPICEEAHVPWYERAVADPDRLLLIGVLGERKIGMVRFDCRHASLWEVSIAIAQDARGKRYGRPFLEMALGWLENASAQPTSVLALVRSDNEPSLRLFQSLGFKHEGAEGEFRSLIWAPDSGLS